jgi:arginyl-tRNA--protein-N-Asp/Glu arginylyltransferase
MTTQNIHLYLTSEHECGYFSRRRATNLVPDPAVKMSRELYSRLIAIGYRRSGDFTYRPHCHDCDACLPCRLAVKQFTQRRSQQRCRVRNQDLSVQLVEAHYSDEYFALYRDYINARHGDGDMVNPKPEDFSSFLYSQWSDTFFIEIRQHQRLLAVAATDPVQNGLSAVYSFYDPTENARSLGNFCVLTQIEQAIAMRLEYLYLGYWIRGCRKMQYKSDYQPLQIFHDNQWILQRESA